MAEPTTPKGKIGGKKLPKWAIPAGAVGVVLIVLMLKKKRAASEASATEPGTEGLSNQSFIPVTGENVAGVGAGLSGGGSAGGEGGNNTELLTEIIKGSKEESAANAQSNRELIAALLGTGGGAPSSSGPQGTVQAGAPETQPAAPPTPAPAPAPKKAPPPPDRCGAGSHADFPNGTPPDCWRVSRTRSGGGCECHGHQNGKLVCQAGYAHPKKGQQPCHW